MISAEPAARVTEMASIAANDTGFTEALCQAPLEEILRAVRDHSEFRAKYEDYLAKFGDRCMEELKLESETLHENPLVLLRGVGELARAPISAPENLAHSDVAADAVKQMRASLRGSPLRVWLLMWVLRKASVTVRQRRIFALSEPGFSDGCAAYFVKQAKDSMRWAPSNSR